MSKWWWRIGVVIVISSIVIYRKYKKELGDIKIDFTLPEEFI